MSSTITRLLAVGTAAAVALVGFVPTASAAPTALPAVGPVSANHRAAAYLAGYDASADGYGGQLTKALGLAVADTNSTAAQLRTVVGALKTDAATQTKDNPGRAANAIILADMLHQKATDFGGTNLVANLRASISSDGQVGSFGSAYAQALAIIALKRAGHSVDAAIVTKLLSYQATDAANLGAFGYDFGGFVADPDSTALAIEALNLLNKKTYKAQIAGAVGWAQKNQKPEGYWEAYSPVDSTSLMASALKQAGFGVKKARSWVVSQQLSNGGFPAALGSTDANLLATADATFALTGKSLAKGSYALKPFTKSPRPKITGVKRVGQTLTADARTWVPAAELGYQWYRGMKKIAGATGNTYQLVTADKGRKIRVLVTASGDGLKPTYEVSKPTMKIKKAA